MIVYDWSFMSILFFHIQEHILVENTHKELLRVFEISNRPSNYLEIIFTCVIIILRYSFFFSLLYLFISIFEVLSIYNTNRTEIRTNEGNKLQKGIRKLAIYQEVKFKILIYEKK